MTRRLKLTQSRHTAAGLLAKLVPEAPTVRDAVALLATLKREGRTLDDLEAAVGLHSDGSELDD